MKTRRKSPAASIPSKPAGSESGPSAAAAKKDPNVLLSYNSLQLMHQRYLPHDSEERRLNIWRNKGECSLSDTNAHHRTIALEVPQFPCRPSAKSVELLPNLSNFWAHAVNSRAFISLFWGPTRLGKTSVSVS
jgi:hypothetical protein